MRITVVGYGNIGSGIAQQLTAAGHDVVITGRDMARAAALAESADALSLPLESAAADAEVIVLAVPYDAASDVLKAMGDLSEKTILDVTNPLTADYGGLTIGHTTSAAESIAQATPAAHVVKGFNTLFAQVIAKGGTFGEQAPPTFYAGDNDAAKSLVRRLIESIGFAPIDAGPLRNARYLEPLAGLNIYFGYGAGQGTQIAPMWLSRA